MSGQPDAAALVTESGGRPVAAILRKPPRFPELDAVLGAVLDAPADWAGPTSRVWPSGRAS